MNSKHFFYSNFRRVLKPIICSYGSKPYTHGYVTKYDVTYSPIWAKLVHGYNPRINVINVSQYIILLGNSSLCSNNHLLNNFNPSKGFSQKAIFLIFKLNKNNLCRAKIYPFNNNKWNKNKIKKKKRKSILIFYSLSQSEEDVVENLEVLPANHSLYVNNLNERVKVEELKQSF